MAWSRAFLMLTAWLVQLSMLSHLSCQVRVCLQAVVQKGCWKVPSTVYMSQTGSPFYTCIFGAHWFFCYLDVYWARLWWSRGHLFLLHSLFLLHLAVSSHTYNPCFKYRPSRLRYRPISPFFLLPIRYEKIVPYCLQQKIAGIWNIGR